MTQAHDGHDHGHGHGAHGTGPSAMVVGIIAAALSLLSLAGFLFVGH
jgi:hypothetical protein